jgi:hypothetical protein
MRRWHSSSLVPHEHWSEETRVYSSAPSANTTSYPTAEAVYEGNKVCLPEFVLAGQGPQAIEGKMISGETWEEPGASGLYIMLW